MKKTISVFLVLSFALSIVLCFASSAAAGTDYKRGTIRLSYEFGDNISLEIGDFRYMPVDVFSNAAELKLNTENIDTSCAVYLNGELITTFKEPATVSFESASFISGINEITLCPETTLGYYSSEYVYGKFNADDFDLISLELTSADGSVIPVSVVRYMPIVGQSGVTEKVSEYDGKKISLGDGWFADTGLGGSLPEYPIMLGFRFEGGFNSGKSIYEIDTTLLPEGENVIRFYDNETNTYGSETDTIIVNNRAPEVEFAFGSKQYLTSLDDLNIKIKDSVSGISKAVIKLDDKRIKTLYKAGEYDLSESGLADGKHTVCVTTSDKAGNEDYYFAFFEYSSQTLSVPVAEGGKLVSGSDADIYAAKLIKDINLYVSGSVGCGDALGCSDELLVPMESMTDTYSSYQSFLVNVSECVQEYAYVNCRANVKNGGKYEVSAYDYSQNKWVPLATAGDGQYVTVPLKIKDSGFVSDSKARIRISPKLIGNGSDTMLWYTDTQYYSTFEDLNFLYQSIAEYAAQEYADGNIAYALFTGDFVDDARTRDRAEKEYAIADRMQKIIDDSGLPNGVLAGNHDVAHDSLVYDYYHKYFPASRFNGQECFGGAINQNECHFDLISLGGYDFVILCFGYGKNGDPDTIAWANAVLKAYPERNAILATHEYINASGRLLSTNAQKMLEEIAIPNENVKMILCGHFEGACSQWREIPGTDRKILEILHDFQFAELKEGPQHVINNCTCDGEAFLRLMRFTTSGQLVMSTYSPYYDLDCYFAPYQDNGVFDLDLISGTQSVKTLSFNVAYQTDKTDTAADYDAAFCKKGNAYSDFVVINGDFMTASYVIKNTDHTNSSGYDNTFGEVWYSGIEPTLFTCTDSTAPSADVANRVYDLIPQTASNLKRSSGVANYEASIDEKGALHLMPTSSEYNWITVGWAPYGAEIGKNPYVYLSVRTGSATKWGIQIVTSTNRRLHFALDLYERFGYKSYSVPSDLVGTWQGYIDLSNVLNENERISNIYFTAAVPYAEVIFDYCFIGTPAGVKAEFKAGDAVRIYDVAKNGTLNDPGMPFVDNKQFDGWYTESGE